MQCRSSRRGLIEAEHIFEQIMAENFPNLRKDIHLQTQKKLNYSNQNKLKEREMLNHQEKNNP